MRCFSACKYSNQFLIFCVHASASLSVSRLYLSLSLKWNWLFWCHIRTCDLDFYAGFSVCKYSNPFLIFCVCGCASLRYTVCANFLPVHLHWWIGLWLQLLTVTVRKFSNTPRFYACSFIDVVFAYLRHVSMCRYEGLFCFLHSEVQKYARPKPACTNQVSKVGNFVITEVGE